MKNRANAIEEILKHQKVAKREEGSYANRNISRKELLEMASAIKKLDQQKKDKLRLGRNFEYVPDLRSVLIAIDETPTKKVTRNGR